MRKSFADTKELAAWTSAILATDHLESYYEDMQLQLGDICIPLGNTKNRRVICEQLVQSFIPVLPFLTWEKVCTLERSDMAGDYFRYQADTLLEDLYMDDNPPILSILSLKDVTVTRYELYVENHHKQGLSLDRLWRIAVLNYLANTTLPFTYILTGSQFLLTDTTDNYERMIRCTDTNIYLRAYEIWFEMKDRYERTHMRLKARA